MGKGLLAFSFLITIFFILIFPTTAAAVGTCPIRTTPTPLLNTDRMGGFYINVGDGTKYSKLNVEFNCGIRPFKTQADKYSDTEIYVGLNKSDTSAGTPCEFDPGDHRVTVSIENSNGEVPLCQASYKVIDRAAKDCTLTLDPPTGFDSGTILKVNGDKISTSNSVGEGMTLFFDDDAIDIPNLPGGNFADPSKIMVYRSGNVKMPSFEETIPQQLMTQGVHLVSLRQRKFDLINLLLTVNPQSWSIPRAEKDYFSDPYCQIQFEVGTPGKPGGVLAPGTAVITDVCKTDPDKCSLGGGESCEGDDPNKGPGFKTAIGCIHTNPTELVKDFLKFGVGIGGGLAFLMMLLGAFQMLTSAGNPETLNAGKDRLTNAVIGLLFIIFAVLLLQIIGVGILNIPEFK